MINQVAAIAGAACLVVGGALVHPSLGWATAGAWLTALAVGGVKSKAGSKTK